MTPSFRRRSRSAAIGSRPIRRRPTGAIRCASIKTGSGLDDDVLIDLMRLQRASGALAGETDYYRYANTRLLKGYPGEAKAVLEEGFAAKSIDRNKPIFRDVLAAASAKTAADRASLPGLERAALASPAAKQSMVTGDAYLGYGDYAKAAAMYRAALTKSRSRPQPCQFASRHRAGAVGRQGRGDDGIQRG